MEAWDIIVVGDGPAALRAAAAAAKHGASTLMVAVNALGSSTDAGRDGFAASVQESNNRSHREDTIRNGAFLCDQDIVAQRTADAVRNLDLLERWGVNFRRDSTGLPLVSKAMSHSKPRVADAGDATAREVQKPSKSNACDTVLFAGAITFHCPSFIRIKRSTASRLRT